MPPGHESLERHEGLHDEIDGRIGGARHLAGIAVRFDHDARPDLDDAVRAPRLARLGELGEHDDADDRETRRRTTPNATGIAPGRGGSGTSASSAWTPSQPCRGARWRRRRSPLGGASKRRVVHRSSSRIVEDPIGLVDRRHRHLASRADPFDAAGRDGARVRAAGRPRGSRRRPRSAPHRGRRSESGRTLSLTRLWASGRQYPASTSTRPNSSSPRAKRRTFSVTRCARSGLAISGVLPTCGVMMQFGSVHSG